jgi:cytoskeletal protein CcmA (bactofilin family)
MLWRFWKRWTSSLFESTRLVVCPRCNNEQKEPKRVLSTFCRGCGVHLTIQGKKVVASHTTFSGENKRDELEIDALPSLGSKSAVHNKVDHRLAALGTEVGNKEEQTLMRPKVRHIKERILLKAAEELPLVESAKPDVKKIKTTKLQGSPRMPKSWLKQQPAKLDRADMIEYENEDLLSKDWSQIELLKVEETEDKTIKNEMIDEYDDLFCEDEDHLSEGKLKTVIVERDEIDLLFDLRAAAAPKTESIQKRSLQSDPMVGARETGIRKSAAYRSQYLKDIQCFQCGHKMRVAKSLKQISCEKCGADILLADIEINTKRAGDFKTRGDIIVRKTGHIQGRLLLCRDLILSGRVDVESIEVEQQISVRESSILSGKIKAKKLLIPIGLQLSVQEAISVEEVELYGTLNASLHVSGKVLIGSKAVMNGDVTARSIILESGGKVLGKMQIINQEIDS